jgi:glucose/arabinose dehydrogenase/type 1 glutamine amidotransferase
MTYCSPLGPDIRRGGARPLSDTPQLGRDTLMHKNSWYRRISMYATLAVASAGLVAVSVSSATPAAAAIIASDFQQVTLAKGEAEVGEPMTISVLPDRSVLHTARNGTLRRTDANGTTSVIANIPVYTHDEEGLQGVAADPDFASNRYIYLYYAPPLNTPAGDAPATGTATDWATWTGVNRLSRFTLNADFTVNVASQVTILDVPASRGMCCHVGGSIDFDAAGNLYLSTGDDTNPFDSAGYSPIDERANRNPAYDAQRSSANTNDLRGKILRITVNADGSYSIPAGNLFPSGTASTRPEIYAMGFRNPFRMKVDKITGVVYVGDYGPDAGGTQANHGPSGQVEFNRVTGPGNYGWPYCTGTNTANETYNEWDFATNSTGPKFDCAGGPTNNSFRNTGLTTLPPAKASWIRYGGDAGTPPEFGGSGSESPMGGPVYHYDEGNPSTTKFPQSLDGRFFAGELGRGWIKPIKINDDGSPGAIETFPWNGKQVMDMAFGPDGALYVLDYGTGYFHGDANSALYRYDYVGPGNHAPTAVASGDKTSGQPPVTVNFSSSGSADPEGDALSYSWAFGDGGTSTDANPSHTYATNGNYTATLTVRDPQGATGSSSVLITVGNTAPTVTINSPAAGQLTAFGESVPWSVTVSDPEDGAIDCSKVTMAYVLGHDQHAHQITSQAGCSGTITIPADGEHDDAANIFPIFDASYTDKGGLTTHTQNILQPKHRQAEHFKTSSGVNTVPKTAAEGGKTVGEIHNGDWIEFDPYKLNDATSFSARVSSGGAGGTLQFRTGSPTGAIIGSATVPVTGSWETFTTVTGTISGAPAGTTSLYLTFAGSTTAALFDMDSFTFNQSGTGSSTGPIKGLAGKCLDVAGGNSADGTQVQLFGCNSSPAQTWTVSGQQLKVLGKCLDIAGGSTADGAKIQLWSCNGSGAQNWVPQADGSLKNPQSNKCLDVAGSNSADGTVVTLWTCSGDANQKWTLPGTGPGGGVLVFSKTAGFRHDSIPAGIQAIRELGAANSFTVTATEDADAFTTANLAQYDAVVFLNTTQDVLNDAQQIAFESYIRGGGGFVGVHAAADTEYDWPFYGQLVGAYFASHPAIQQVDSKTENRAHPATAHLPQTWTRTDELYNYQTNPRRTARVLATLDESSYSGGSMGADHPIVWCKTIDNGRSFYTGFGHTQETYADSNFRNQLLGGILYAAKRAQADCRPENDHTTLYDGDTAGWAQSGPGSFTSTDATLSSVGGTGLFWYTTKQYTSYSLKADFRITGDSNSGIFVGFPNPGNDPNVAVNQGYEIQIDATDSADRTTGAIYGVKSADIAARDAALNPSGQWNTFEILVDGQRIRVYLNGSLINDFTNTDPNRNLDGYVGIQNHGSADQVAFRNIRINDGTSDVTVQAESYSSASGVQPFTKAGANGGQTLGFIDPGDWAGYDNVNVGGATSFRARVASGGPGGQIQIRTGSPTGTILGTVNVPNTGGWQSFADVSTTLTGVPAGIANVYLTFTGTGTGLFDVDDFQLTSAAVDNVAPTVAASVGGTPSGGFYTGPVEVTLTATDNAGGSGVGKVEYQLDAASTWTAYTAPIAVSGDGTHQVQYRASDKAGNVSTPGTQEVKIDATSPVTTAAFAPASDAGWHNGATPVTLAATDAGSGVSKVEWSLDGGPWTPYTTSVNVTGQGQHELLYKSTDVAGNMETLKSAILKIDGNAPTVIVSGLADGQLYGDSQDVRVTWQAVDPTSGVKSVIGSLDGGAYQTGTLQAMYELYLGMHKLTVVGTDNAGNATTTTVTFFVTTSFRDMQNLLDRFKATSRLPNNAHTKLSNQLAKARKAEASGNDATALKQLAAFRKLLTAQLVPDAEVRNTLIRDSDAMTIRLGGTPPNNTGVTANAGKTLKSTGRLDEDPNRLGKNRKL